MIAAKDDFELQRFVDAQEQVFETALAELRAGRKRTHWMWFIFPQLRGLGHSTTAHRYGIATLDEARAYLDHPVLADRLARATEAVLAHRRRSAHDIFGSPDDLKFRSSMTLFDEASEHGVPEFRAALENFFGGTRDHRTLEALRR
jgi:uncharacterized protein (DUF1810 family)